MWFRVESEVLRFASGRWQRAGIAWMDEVGKMGFATGAEGIATLIGIPEGTYRLVEKNNFGCGRVELVAFTVTVEST